MPDGAHVDSCPLKDFVLPPRAPVEDAAVNRRIADVEREVGQVAQAVQDMTRTWTESQRNTENRFTEIFNKLEQNNNDAIRRTESLGNNLSNDIKGIHTLRTSSMLPQIVALLAMASLFAGAVYMYMSGQSGQLNQQMAAQTTLFAQQINAQNAAITRTDTTATNNLQEVNKRLFESQHEKGRADERTAQLEKAFMKFASDYELRHKDLDDKLQKEMAKERDLVKAEISGMDSLWRAELRGETKAVEGTVAELKAKQASVQDWQLRHSEETAYFRGKTDATAASQADQQKTVEERQYRNTGTTDSVSTKIDDIEHRVDLLSARQYDMTKKGSEAGNTAAGVEQPVHADKPAGKP